MIGVRVEQERVQFVQRDGAVPVRVAFLENSRELGFVSDALHRMAQIRFGDESSAVAVNMVEKDFHVGLQPLTVEAAPISQDGEELVEVDLTRVRHVCNMEQKLNLCASVPRCSSG